METSHAITCHGDANSTPSVVEKTIIESSSETFQFTPVDGYDIAQLEISTAEGGSINMYDTDGEYKQGDIVVTLEWQEDGSVVVRVDNINISLNYMQQVLYQK